MRRIIFLAGHGEIASGVASAVYLIAGKVPGLRVASPYTGDTDTLIAEARATLAEADEVLIVTDLLGGSVANTLTQFATDPKVQLVTGLNLGLILELVLDPNRPLEEVLAEARLGLTQISITTTEDEEF